VPIVALLIAYDIARGHADVDLSAVNYHAQIDFDRFLTGGVLPTDWLQGRLHTRGADPAPWDYALWAIYVTHFIVPWLTLALLWRASRDRFRALRDRLVVLTVAGCTIYTLYPAAPPWLSATPPIDRLISPIWNHVGLKVAAPVFESGSGFVNPVAAVPSLHAAYPCLLLLFFWDRGGAVRALLGMYTFLMGFALVYTGEHYVFDILVGWALAGAVALAFRLVPLAWAAAMQRVRPEPRRQAETARP
jgi:membrane-associated phospholipid phosphatase